MLDYIILNRKNNIYYVDDNNNEEQFIDLLTKTCNEYFNDKDEVIIVNEHYVARPDLISLAVYGDDSYADVICKYNGISNPFELNENDILHIPHINDMEKIINTDVEKNDLVSESNTISVKRKYPTQKDKNEKRSPADSVSGEENFVIDKSMGIVFY
jgi:hypothetical protein